MAVGERSVLIRAVKGEGPAGTVVESDTTLQVKVVSQAPAAKGPPRLTRALATASTHAADPENKCVTRKHCALRKFLLT